MKTRIALTFVLPLALAVIAGCQRGTPSGKPAHGGYTVQTWVLPAEAGSMAPHLQRASGDRLLLSWINRAQGRRNALQFSSYTDAAGWQSQARTIAVGNSLLANAADTPHLLATPDGALWAQWLQTQADSPSGYDTILARSKDGGMSWTQMTRVNDDGKPAEHGFAVLWPRGSNGVGLAWLDGREQVAAGHEHHKAMGAMQLRSNTFNLDLQRSADTVVDARSCDCCQTAVAMTDQGPLLAWRDRSDDDIRDIAVTRFDDGVWLAPKIVHADGWKVQACPVSGPALTAVGKAAVLAWYSEAGGVPALQMARSTNAGDTFTAPVTVEKGAAVLGRSGVALDGQQVWVTWLREDKSGQTLMLARYSADLSKALQTFTVAKLQAQGLASGYPQLAADNGVAWLVWTDVVGGVPHLKGARVAQ